MSVADPVSQFFILQGFILVPFALGAWFRGRLLRPDLWSRRLIRLNLVTIEPVLGLWVIWGLGASLTTVGLLPVFGFGVVLVGLLLGWIAQRAFGYATRESRATFIISASLANHGFTLGGFVCYLLLGEAGLGLSAVFVLYFYAYIYLVVFPFAGRAGSGGQPVRLLALFLSPNYLPFYAALVGAALLLAGVERPDWPLPLQEILYVALVFYYFSLGLTFRGPGLWSHRRAILLLSAIKFLAVPAIVALVLRLFPLAPIAARVVTIEATMPAAVYSVVTAVLFELDRDLAAALFVGTSVLFLVLVMPVIFFFG